MPPSHIYAPGGPPPAATGHEEASPNLTPRALMLVVVRESDERNVVQFDGMREQTYQTMSDNPAIEAIRKVGLAPMTAGSSFTVEVSCPDAAPYREEVIVEHLREGKTKAIMFALHGHWHLWSQSSAARASASGTNEFTNILIEAIKRLRPIEVRAANISRLIRSQRHATLLQYAMYDNVDRIVAGGLRFELAGEHAGVGSILFSTLAMAAAMERDWIVQRTSSGRVAKWRRGEWPFGTQGVPEGYRYDKKSRSIVPCENQRPMIREMLLILGSDAPPSEMQRQLAEIGMMSRHIDPRFGRKVSVDVMNTPRTLVRRLYTHAGVWAHGEFLFRLANPFLGANEFAGLEVVRTDPRDRGELQMLMRVPVPEGGWAEQEVIDRFLVKALASSQDLLAMGRTELRPLSWTVREGSVNPDLHARLLNSTHTLGDDDAARARAEGAYAKQLIAPLAGREWTAGENSYRLFAQKRGRYFLMEWPKDAIRASRVRITGRSLSGLEQS